MGVDPVRELTVDAGNGTPPYEQLRAQLAALVEAGALAEGDRLPPVRGLAADLGLTDVRDLRPAYADLAIQDPGADLYKTSTDACCALRKVAPLDLALRGFDAWITGRKRFHGGSRLHLPVVEGVEGKLKFNPLASFGKAELDAYAAEHALPAHPLVAFGYASVGCWPCTKPPRR